MEKIKKVNTVPEAKGQRVRPFTANRVGGNRTDGDNTPALLYMQPSPRHQREPKFHARTFPDGVGIRFPDPDGRGSR